MKYPRFEIYKDAAGEWRWRLRAANGKIVADSAEGYAERNKARVGAERVIDLLSITRISRLFRTA